MPFYIYFISRQNIQNTRYLGIFSDESVVDDWYKAVLALSKKNPGEVKYSIEKVSREWYTLPHSDHVIHVTRNAPENELKEFKGKCFWLLMDDVGGRHLPLINNNGSNSGGGSGNSGNPNNPGLNTGGSTRNISGNPGSNTGQGGNPTGGNTGGSGNSTGSNPNESGANKPNSGSGLNQKQKLALDEIFKNLQMQRTDNDDQDLEELRKVSQKLAELLNMQNVNKKINL
ncbi:13065_t:CDS:2 [Dentiscutata erythropus]|uniref:13065_t:CDS:1 n=1 Tax=Dentiscutata erythropus TaxID=1348616 RepID=A0A9N9JLM4_9GLOM|nr:13065_t:CDS:2 [Dentiscutata erythropus]